MLLIETEDVVYDLYKKVLCIEEEFSREETFVQLGGQSILAAKLQIEIFRALGIRVALKDLMKYNTVKKLAEQLSGSFPLSDMQRMYNAGRHKEAVLGGTGSRSGFELMGSDIDANIFCTACKRLLETHAMLRARIGTDSQRIEQVFEPKVAVHDLRLLNHEESVQELEHIREEVLAPFAGEDFPLWRVGLVYLPDGGDRIVFGHDGRIADGWSQEILRADLERFYREAHTSCEESAQNRQERAGAAYADYLSFLETMKQTPAFADDEKFWKARLRSCPLPPELPLLERPENVRDVRTKQISRHISQSQWNGVCGFAAKQGVTSFALLLTAFGKVMGRYSQNRRFLLNLPVSVRPPEMEFDRLVGLCSNIVLFEFSDDAQSALCEQAAENLATLMDMREHACFQGTDALAELARTSGGDLVAPITFTSLLDIPASDQVAWKRVRTGVFTSQVWIEALAVNEEDGVALTLNYVDALFSPWIMEGIADTFVETVVAAYEQPALWLQEQEIPLSARDRKIIEELNNTGRVDELPALEDWLEGCLERYPDRLAVGTPEGSFTYAEIRRQRNGMLNALMRANLAPSARIAVLLRKGYRQVVTALAAMRGGYAYMPIENTLPPESIAVCLHAANIDIVVTEIDFIAVLKEVWSGPVLDATLVQEVEEAPAIPRAAMKDAVRIIINTSGSSGRPKSVLLGEKGIVNCLWHSRERLSLSEGFRVLSVTDFSHDMAIFDTIGSFLFGGTVVLPHPDMQKEPQHWLDLMEKYRVNVWNSVPTFMEMLLLSGGEKLCDVCDNLQTVILGGDWIRPQLASKLFERSPKARLFSVGGPTETTIWNICHQVRKEDVDKGAIPYGKPFPNTCYHLLDEALRERPVGCRGVMHVSGIGVAQGYAKPEETGERFISWNGKRIYNTGDLGAVGEDGTIAILGRVDFQVKINGKRIELGGIENVLVNSGLIRSCQAVVSEGKKKIVAYFTAENPVDEAELRRFARANLAEYMVPASFVQLDRIPLTQRGKPDRKALAAMQAIETTISAEGNRTGAADTEMELLEACKELLEDDTLDGQEDFYAMGGDSVAATKLSSWIYDRYGVEFMIYDVLVAPYISSWAERINASMK